MKLFLTCFLCLNCFLFVSQLAGQADSVKVSTLLNDTMANDTPVFERSYRVRVRLNHGQGIVNGYLYRLNEHSITVCNKNPMAANFKKSKIVVFTVVPDTSISFIQIRRNNRIKHAVLAGVGAGLASGLIVFAVSEDDKGGLISFTRADKGFLMAIATWFSALPVVSVLSIPRILRVYGSPVGYHYALMVMKRKTGYKVYPGYGK